MQTASTHNLWLVRLLIGAVLLSNLYAALNYLLNPWAFVAAFDLQSAPGMAAIFGMGLLFLMWQIPYLFALLQPVKNHISLMEANLMQAIGLAGESMLLTRIPAEFSALRGSIQRFMVFDAVGLLLLSCAYLLGNRIQQNQRKERNV